MTLTTRIAVLNPVPVRELLDFVNSELLHAENVAVVEHHGRIGNASRVFLGGGVTWPLDALVWINYAEDGPLWPEPEIDEGQVRTPACALTLGFDTPYGYSVGGAGCGDLHASYIVRLVPWFDAHRTGFKWCLEGTGKWYDDLDYIDKLGDHRLVAS